MTYVTEDEESRSGGNPSISWVLLQEEDAILQVEARSPSILCVAEHEEGRVSPLISWRRITQPLTAAMRRFEGKLWSLLIVHLGRRIVISHSLCFFFISKLNFLQKNQVFFLSVWVHRRSDTIQKLEG